MRGLTRRAAVLFAGSALFAPLLLSQCRAVHLEITDSSAPEGCTSAYHFCAAGAVEGNRGLNGTTYFVLDGVGTGPATGPGYSPTSGILVYTLPEGTLTVRKTGIGKFSGNPSNGYGAGIEDVISGTGRYLGATGSLQVRQRDENNIFYSKITGQLCLPEDKGHEKEHGDLSDGFDF
jgi:hypothetical protein